MKLFKSYRPRPSLSRFKFKPRSVFQRKEALWKKKTTAPKQRAHHESIRLSPAGRKAGRGLQKIGKHWLNKPPIVRRGEREICNPATAEGRAEYKYRTMLLWLRQEGWCCFHEYDFCPGRLKLSEATMEHEKKRTRAGQDDRLYYLDDAGKEIPLNGAAHLNCNKIAGSRKLPIWHGNVIFEKEKAASMNKDNIRKYLKPPTEGGAYTDQSLAALRAHCEDGKLSFRTCCCFVGFPTANHAYQPGIGIGELILQGVCIQHLRHARDLAGAQLAEHDFYYLGKTDEERCAALHPLILEEQERRVQSTTGILDERELIAQ
jgi:hypothetical protein